MVKHEMSDLTTHALQRMKQRGIPRVLIDEAIKRGRRVILYDRKMIEYTLKNVLGLRGVNLVVLQGMDGAIVTSYATKSGPRKSL